jgi:hypothetical protein
MYLPGDEREESPVELSEVLSGIRRGEMDASLPLLSEAVKARQTALGQSIKVGSRVRFNSLCGKRFLVGAAGTVTRRAGSKLVVDLDHAHWSPGAQGKPWQHNIRCSPAMLEAV